MFSVPDLHNQHILHGEYSLSIVILSVVIACCASYTALSMNQRMQQNTFFHRSFWLLLSSIAMGLGIWSMHFVGMSAFMLPIPMEYDLLLTTISILPAVCASYLAFFIANGKYKTHRPYIMAGIIMGIGISAMHYIGMAAMEMEASYYYRVWILIASIAIAITVSYVALYIFSTLQKYMGNILIKLVTSLLMGVAITSMHYTGMSAVVFYVEESMIDRLSHMHEMDVTLLIIVITIGISILFAISGLTNLLDRYVEYRLHHFDALTLFPNQRQFEQDLNQTKKLASIAILHIQNLERWISSQGYTFGDELIKEVGKQIQECKPASIKVYRIEGNRFALINHEEDRDKNMKVVMGKILSIFKKPILIDKNYIVVDMVCSIAKSDQKKSARETFSNSMAVLQDPSIRFKHEVIEYDPAIHMFSFERQIVSDISRAMENDELFLQYQPKVCSKSLQTSGVEALLRWKHPELGMISPGVFIPILEDNGKIFDVTDWVIQAVCKQISAWIKGDIPFHQVSINIPGPYVTSPRLLMMLSQNLSTYKIDSNMIELEITETSVIDDIENAITAVSKFRELGLSVALDDFGTGLSSLSYLKRIPISTIKIDKSFVDGIPVSEKDSALLKAIITLCYSLNLQVVIEGVESKEQMEFIISMTKTPLIQGYYFSRPLPAKELVEWLQERESAQTGVSR
ncbi:bifunctional diguanylate cyclase/phosphodiesterase [Bacillus sp. AK128]